MEESLIATYALNSGHFYKSIKQFFGIPTKKTYNEDGGLMKIFEREKEIILPAAYSQKEKSIEISIPKKQVEIYNIKGKIVKRDSLGKYIDFKL
jgi:uncharacterized protein YkuJ